MRRARDDPQLPRAEVSPRPLKGGVLRGQTIVALINGNPLIPINKHSLNLSAGARAFTDGLNKPPKGLLAPSCHSMRRRHTADRRAAVSGGHDACLFEFGAGWVDLDANVAGTFADVQPGVVDAAVVWAQDFDVGTYGSAIDGRAGTSAAADVATEADVTTVRLTIGGCAAGGRAAARGSAVRTAARERHETEEAQGQW